VLKILRLLWSVPLKFRGTSLSFSQLLCRRGSSRGFLQQRESTRSFASGDSEQHELGEGNFDVLLQFGLWFCVQRESTPSRLLFRSVQGDVRQEPHDVSSKAPPSNSKSSASIDKTVISSGCDHAAMARIVETTRPRRLTEVKFDGLKAAGRRAWCWYRCDLNTQLIGLVSICGNYSRISLQP
jgi:hypothetical protein